MDLRKRTLEIIDAADAGVWMPVLDELTREPLGEREGKPVRIKLAGLKSRAVQKVIRDLRDKELASLTRRSVRAPNLEDRQIAILTAATLDWENIEWNGEPLPCTPTNIRMLYTECPWLVEQIDEFVANPLHFDPGSQEKPLPSLADPAGYVDDVEKK